MVIAFGFSDCYSWLQEDEPREECTLRRSLPFDEALRPLAITTTL